ncbi:DUF397 domain-containing protein [Amycolatopsis minnesotensis]|uniref:DUF397 domain-containing protein n=1 Tax=Amycolatopsis minnesotensis TaxID=337894 RepID=A0ABP5CCA6_9PSEU
MSTPGPASRAWRKSSYSNGAQNCVEAADLLTGMAVRDSKQRDTGPELTFTRAGWNTFLNHIEPGR